MSNGYFKNNANAKCNKILKVQVYWFPSSIYFILLGTKRKHITSIVNVSLALDSLVKDYLNSPSEGAKNFLGKCKEALGIIPLLWVSQHSGIRGNEIARRLASLGIG